MLNIDLNDQGLCINGKIWTFPIPLEAFCTFLGTYRKVNHSYYIWDDEGLLANSNDNDLIDYITFSLNAGEYQQQPQFAFSGKICFYGQPLIDYYKAHPEQRIALSEGDDKDTLLAQQISVSISINETRSFISFQAYQAPEIPTPLPLDTGFEFYRTLWQDWLDAIEKYVPTYHKYYNLTYGIQQQDIDEQQESFEGKLPANLINFYKVHNVNWEFVTSAFKFHTNGWDYDLLPFSKLYEEWENITDLNEEYEDQDFEHISEIISDINYDPKIKCHNYANPNWIPIAEGRNGDYLLIDLDPSEHGTMGQIIELQNEAWSRIVCFDSFEQLLESTIQQLQTGNDTRYEWIQSQKDDD